MARFYKSIWNRKCDSFGETQSSIKTLSLNAGKRLNFSTLKQRRCLIFIKDLLWPCHFIWLTLLLTTISTIFLTLQMMIRLYWEMKFVYVLHGRARIQSKFFFPDFKTHYYYCYYFYLFIIAHFGKQELWGGAILIWYYFNSNSLLARIFFFL